MTDGKKNISMDLVSLIFEKMDMNEICSLNLAKSFLPYQKRTLVSLMLQEIKKSTFVGEDIKTLVSDTYPILLIRSLPPRKQNKLYEAMKYDPYRTDKLRIPSQKQVIRELSEFAIVMQENGAAAEFFEYEEIMVSPTTWQKTLRLLSKSQLCGLIAELY